MALVLTVVVLYGAGIAATWWLTGNVTVFQMVCVDDRGAVSVVWPFTWLAALCAALLIGTAMAHERWFAREDPEPD